MSHVQSTTRQADARPLDPSPFPGGDPASNGGEKEIQLFGSPYNNAPPFPFFGLARGRLDIPEAKADRERKEGRGDWRWRRRLSFLGRKWAMGFPSPPPKRRSLLRTRFPGHVQGLQKNGAPTNVARVA